VAPVLHDSGDWIAGASTCGTWVPVRTGLGCPEAVETCLGSNVDTIRGIDNVYGLHKLPRVDPNDKDAVVVPLTPSQVYENKQYALLPDFFERMYKKAVEWALELENNKRKVGDPDTYVKLEDFFPDMMTKGPSSCMAKRVIPDAAYEEEEDMQNDDDDGDEDIARYEDIEPPRDVMPGFRYTVSYTGLGSLSQDPLNMEPVYEAQDAEEELAAGGKDNLDPWAPLEAARARKAKATKVDPRLKNALAVAAEEQYENDPNKAMALDAVNQQGDDEASKGSESSDEEYGGDGDEESEECDDSD
jgi:hypothetical protein